MSIPQRLLMAAEDLRQYPRTSASLPVDVSLGRGKTFHHQGRIVDLSEGGALIHLVEPCISGEVLTVRFVGANVGELVCEGIVRSYAANRGVGVEFVGLSDAKQRRVGTLVAQGRG